jgi:hypothetical protein
VLLPPGSLVEPGGEGEEPGQKGNQEDPLDQDMAQPAGPSDSSLTNLLSGE